MLLWVLLLNAGLAAALGIAGLLADSSALVANALDNASDSIVYLLSWAAVDRAARWKIGAARISGWLLLAFSVGVMLDVVRRFLTGAEPIGPTMVVLALIAAAVNLLCLKLLQRLGTQDVNLKAAQTFSFNDFISNGGILVAGGLVLWLDQSWPDLGVGAAVAIVAFKGGLEILESARDAEREPR